MVDIDWNKQLDKNSSVELRMFDSNSNRTICKVLTLRELKQIHEILGSDIWKENK